MTTRSTVEGSVNRGRALPSEELYALAAERATKWAVWRAKPSGYSFVKTRLVVVARSEQEALRKGGKYATVARPWLPTSAWLQLPPVQLNKKRR